MYKIIKFFQLLALFAAILFNTSLMASSDRYHGDGSKPLGAQILHSLTVPNSTLRSSDAATVQPDKSPERKLITGDQRSYLAQCRILAESLGANSNNTSLAPRRTYYDDLTFHEKSSLARRAILTKFHGNDDDESLKLNRYTTEVDDRRQYKLVYKFKLEALAWFQFNATPEQKLRKINSYCKEDVPDLMPEYFDGLKQDEVKAFLQKSDCVQNLQPNQVTPNFMKHVFGIGSNDDLEPLLSTEVCQALAEKGYYWDANRDDTRFKEFYEKFARKSLVQSRANSIVWGSWKIF